MATPKVTIVIPVLNEEGNVAALLQELKTVFAGLPEIEFEIIFVDDGSTDETLPVLMRSTYFFHQFFQKFREG